MDEKTKVRALQSLPGKRKKPGDTFDVSAQEARDLERAGRAERVTAEKAPAGKPSGK